jgi:hypothetical protein
MTTSMREFLVTSDVLLSDIDTEAKYIELGEMQDRALSPYLYTNDHTGLEVTLVRDWRTSFVDDDYTTIQLWLSPDEETLRRIYERLPLVQASRQTVQHVTLLTPALADPGGPHLRDRSHGGVFDRSLVHLDLNRNLPYLP